jgi:hypothetical protein
MVIRKITVQYEAEGQDEKVEYQIGSYSPTAEFNVLATFDNFEDAAIVFSQLYSSQA